jgi:hypothetical protein
LGVNEGLAVGLAVTGIGRRRWFKTWGRAPRGGDVRAARRPQRQSLGQRAEGRVGGGARVALVAHGGGGEELAEAREAELHRDVDVRRVHERVPARVDRGGARAAGGDAQHVPRRVPEAAVGGARDAGVGALAQHRVAARVDDAARVDLREAAHLHEHRVGRELRRHRDDLAARVHRDEPHLGTLLRRRHVLAARL